MTQPSTRTSWLATLVCFALPLGLYAVTAAHTVQGGDTGEFGLVGMLGGVAHPPGYPIYSLLARAASHLPGVPFWRISMASALCGAAACTLLFRASLRITGNLIASIGAALAFAISPLMWRWSGVPEVFSLHALFCAAILLFALRLVDGEPKRPLDALVLGLTCGLGFTNHQSTIFMAPVVLWALTSVARSAPIPWAFGIAVTTVVSAFVGLLPFALLPTFAHDASASAFVWGHVESWRGLMHHILRSDYGATSLYSGPDAQHEPARQILLWVRQLPTQYDVLFSASGLLGIALLTRKRMGFAIALVASLALSGLLFPALFNLPDTAINREVASRFYLMPNLLCVPFISVGLARIADALTPVWTSAIVASGLLFLGVHACHQANWAADSSVEKLIVAQVQATRPNAVIIGISDANEFGTLWVTQVLGVRRDVHYIDVNLMSYRWYMERMQRELPKIQIPPLSGPENAAALATAFGKYVPTYVTPWLAEGVGKTITLERTGFLHHVMPLGAPPIPHHFEEDRLDAATKIFGPQPPPIDAYAEMAHIAVASEWLSLSLDYRGNRNDAKADAARKRAHEIMPEEK